ncbi:MAG: preprotein translocase subunit SecY [Elusimicrobia bacterium]|nr:preprotein translocase subunit SecY [Elusimicrobiota bacterium]
MSDNTISNIFNAPELKKRLLFVLVALFVFRVAASIPIPGINTDVIRQIFNMQQNGVLGFLDIFSGGAMSRFSILALGIMPYINASIIIGLVRGAHLIPALDRMHKEGEAGRRKENQITRVFALVLAAFQGFGLTFALGKMSAPGGISAIIDPSFTFYLVTTLTLTTGTMFVMWLGEQITEKGIGNGISLIIFAGIVDRLPNAIWKVIKSVQVQEMSILTALLIFAIVALVMAFVVWVETAQRQIPVQYAKRQIGNKIYGGQTSYLPLKIDQSGVIAVIFASSIIYMPLTIANFNHTSKWAVALNDWIGRGHPLYFAVYIFLIVFFCYFYNSMTINPEELADNMKKNGGFIPGIRPGEPTKIYIDWVLNRITLSGALFICVIAVLPDLLRIKFNVPFQFGGTALLIAVGVALDTAGQIQAHLMARNYDIPMMKGANKLAGRRWFNVGE